MRRSIRFARSSRFTERTKSPVTLAAVVELLRRVRQHLGDQARRALRACPRRSARSRRDATPRRGRRDRDPAPSAAAPDPRASRRTGRAPCRRARTPGGTGARATRACPRWRTRYDGNFVAITMSIRLPSTSSRSSSRQRNACVSTRAPGYHLNGTETMSASWPRSAELVDERVREDLGAAARERHLRPADGDPHRGSAHSARDDARALVAVAGLREPGRRAAADLGSRSSRPPMRRPAISS